MTSLTCYSDSQAAERLARELPRWTVEDGHLLRRYASNGWRASMLLANGIAHLAEVAWHHPDLTVRWDSVDVRLRTHSEDAISERDFALAAMIEQTATWRPGADGVLEGAPLEGSWRYLGAD
jgi:4a-hydroxytetrahydrobiopterin dehydratase